MEESKGNNFLKRQTVYSLQLIQVTERKDLLTCKFAMAITKGRGTQACMKYD